MTTIRAARRPASCIFCQWQRLFTTSYARLDAKTPPAPAKTNVPGQKAAGPALNPALANAPRSYGKRTDEFTPTPLSRPIGLHTPPVRGENTGIDTRTLRQRRDDFVDYEKHLARREELKSKLLKPYFRDWTNMQFHKGKSFIAPPRAFRADKSLFFPNFYGQTLLKGKDSLRDTTPVLENKVSVVTVFSSMWAEAQAQTFVSAKANPVVHKLLQENGDMLQLVQINMEDNTVKAWLIRLFMGRLRRQVGESNWGRYFVVRRGITDTIREAIGLLNSRVGYTYLVDGNCKIRWAGSGPGEAHEKEGLVKAIQRLLHETKDKRKSLGQAGESTGAAGSR